MQFMELGRIGDKIYLEFIYDFAPDQKILLCIPIKKTLILYTLVNEKLIKNFLLREIVVVFVGE